MKKRTFSQDEIKFLQNNYDKYNIDTLCKMMSRTKDSIRYKASRLNLKCKNYFEIMKDKLEADDYILLSDKYVSAKSTYKIKCNKHNIIKNSTYDCIMQDKYQCDKCRSEKISKALRADVQIVKEEFYKRNLIPKFSDDEYRNNKQQLKYLCPLHNDDYQYISYDSLKRSQFGCIYCAGKFRGENYKGAIHHNWKGGVTNPQQKLRETIEYNKWRKSILKRDKYTCQCCGAKNGNGKTINFRVHHKENFADNPDLRLKIDNGITLCSNCHDPSITGSFHNLYGTHYNNSKQLQKYIKMKKSQSESQKDSLLLC